MEGAVTSPDRAAVGGLHVLIVDKNVGLDVPLAEAVTDELGRYLARFDVSAVQERKQQPDLQTRVYAGETLLASSETKYDAGPVETLNVALPHNWTALPSEYEALTSAIGAQYSGSVRDLQESDERQDVTYLANKIGWDARAVAMAALADQFSQRAAAEGIPPVFFYALFRAGLAANEDTLYQADTQTLRAAWERAAAEGVIPDQLVGEIPAIATRFQMLTAKKLLTAPALLGVSSVPEMLTASGLAAESQQQFADLYATHRTDLPAFWKAVGEAFGDQTASRLQLDGKLGVLTLNNAPLMAKLHDAVGNGRLTDAVQMALAGYFQAEKWGPLLADEMAVPKEIPGDTLQQQLSNYAEFMAAQIRLGYPTASIASMVRSGELAVNLAREVDTFLTEHQGQFEIGVQPIEQYIARNRLEVAPAVVTDVKRLQRVYQITPNDRAMIGLMKNGLDAAYQVVRWDRQTFVRNFAQDLGGEAHAEQTYGRSVQVHNAVLNVAVSYLSAKNGIPLGAHRLETATPASEAKGQILQPTPQGAVAANVSDIIAYVTLEDLFGEMDFCVCDHCRSILSPAAYLVDLLYFIDQTPLEADKVNPQKVLLERRPDIEHLPLTCENTNTALPYIDVVNETLEYFIANDVQKLSLAKYVGHDTDGLATEDLMASPQFVMAAAYGILRDERFPLPLPFHQPLESLRRYFGKFEVSLPLAMERLRKSDDLERGANPYGWRDILMESLGVSRAEYEILTNKTAVPLWRMYGFPEGSTDVAVIEGLSNAKAFARRLEITYEDLVALLKTEFINVTLADPSGSADSCSFDSLELGHIGTAASSKDTQTRLTAVDFVRLLRLIRLWRRTGWTIEQIDAAICALYRADLQPITAADTDTIDKLDFGFNTLLPRLGIVTRVMEALNLTPRRDLLPLLACWSDIGTHGDSALYRQMFLNPALLKQDSAFAENASGGFLTNAGEKLLKHGEALRSAFNLTGDEYDRIVTELGYDASTELTVHNISAIFRRGYLARKLGVSVRELLLLAAPALTGLDPFVAPDPTRPAILQLIALTRALRDQSLKSSAALYLIWNQDLSGRSAPEPAQLTEFARTLRGDFATIDDQFAATEDPGGDIARARTTLVYGEEAADAFFALLDSTLVLDVPYSHPEPALQVAITAVDSMLAYDDFRHRLSHTGLLSAATADSLRHVTGATANFQRAIDTLLARSEDTKGSFFARYPELTALYEAYVNSTTPVAQKRSALLAAFRPELARRRKRQQALQRLSAAASVDLTLTQTLLDPPGVAYPLHAAMHSDQPALHDVVALETPGLSAQFFFRDTASGTADVSIGAAANLDYTAGGNNALPDNPTPGHAISAIWQGLLEASETGFHNIVVEADTGSTVTLRLDEQNRALTRNGTIWRNTDPLELKAGALYEIVLSVETVKDTVKVKWETPKRPREAIAPRYLYPPGIVTRFTEVYVRMFKAASLAVGLRLTANELAHFATHSDYQIGGNGWLNALAVTGNPTAASSVALLKPLQALLDFAHIKAEVSPRDEQLLAVVRDPVGTTANSTSLLYSLTRWDSQSLSDVLAHHGSNIAALGHFEHFCQVYYIFALLARMGIPASGLIAATTNDPSVDTVRGLQSALRARYAADDWRTLVQPINDALRGTQRDALVAYVLHQMRSSPASAHIDTADKLFEYFLMDVEMEPCMQTSRVRHALSSVQLFVERCLMNLEPRVSPASINGRQWEWMKRYRVWEANRKVFLFPENWLEPELRDDKSPFFKEIESELLQSDITEESATRALLNYLAKLEEVARLEPCGIHHVDADSKARTGEVNHVIARTAGAHRKYYYRRYENGYWTAWEAVNLDIEDNPVLPVVWKDRLLLFWVRILKETPIDATNLPTTTAYPGRALASLGMDEIKSDAKGSAQSSGMVAVQAMLCWSEYYNGKWQAAKTSDASRPTRIGQFGLAGANAFDRSTFHLAAGEAADMLVVSVYGEGGASDFVFYNTHSLPVRQEDAPGVPALYPQKLRWFAGDQNHLAFVYEAGDTSLTRNIVQTEIPFQLILTAHTVSNEWDYPFFLTDGRHSFYITSEEELVFIPDVLDFGLGVNTRFNQMVTVPTLVSQKERSVRFGPKVQRDGVLVGANGGVLEPTSLRQHATQVAQIRRGLRTASMIVYGDRQIGPTGAIDLARTAR